MAVRDLTLVTKGQRALLFVLFLICGLAVFLFAVPYHHLFPTNGSLPYNVALTILFLAAALMLRRLPHYKPYWPVAYAFFVAAFANLVQTLLPFGFLIIADNGPAEMATDKLAQFLAIVLSILLLTKLAGDDLGSIFLQRGRLLRGLLFGILFFLLFAFLATLQNGLLNGESLFFDTLRSSWHWILLFVLANSLMEELWFRAIFLRKFKPFLGVTGAVILTALVFGISHLPATYINAGEALFFGALVFILGLVGAVMMFKTDSIWGPVLFHAGYDLVVIMPVLQSM